MRIVASAPRRAVVAAVLLLVVAAQALLASPAQAATAPRPNWRVVPIWDGGDHWQFCHDLADWRGDVDYGVGDPPRSTWAAWVRRLDACWGGKHIVHLRYNHEINGTWYPWSRKTPAQFRRDFADFKAYVKGHSRHARSIDFGLALNYGTHRGTPDSWWTPAADFVAVSVYESPWVTAVGWDTFQRSTISPAWWQRWAAAHHRRLAFGEWGASTPQFQRRMMAWGDANRIVYGAYLYCGTPGADHCGWIAPPS